MVIYTFDTLSHDNYEGQNIKLGVFFWCCECGYSLEASHLIWVWIMKVKGPKNQADFIEVLYVVVNAWGATFWNTREYG